MAGLVHGVDVADALVTLGLAAKTIDLYVRTLVRAEMSDKRGWQVEITLG